MGVETFLYLGSPITSNGRLDAEVNRRITNTFGALRSAIFKDGPPTINIKQNVYQACVL